MAKRTSISLTYYWLQVHSQTLTYNNFVTNGITISDQTNGNNLMWGCMKLKDNYNVFY